MSNLTFGEALEQRYEEVRALIAKVDAGVVDPKDYGYTRELIKGEMIMLNEYRHIIDIQKELLKQNENPVEKE